MDVEQNLLGLVTEFDLINKRVLTKLPELSPGDIKAVAETTAADAMDKRPVTVFFDDNLENVLDVFNRHRSVNPIPVIDHHNKLVGIISHYNLVKLVRLYNLT